MICVWYWLLLMNRLCIWCIVCVRLVFVCCSVICELVGLSMISGLLVLIVCVLFVFMVIMVLVICGVICMMLLFM